MFSNFDMQVVMTEYMAGGGDGFSIIDKNKEKLLQVGIVFLNVLVWTNRV